MYSRFVKKLPPTGKQKEAEPFSLERALSLKEAGKSHEEIASAFGMDSKALQKEVNRNGLALAWSEIGRYNPGFIKAEYESSSVPRDELAKRFGMKGTQPLMCTINAAKEVDAAGPKVIASNSVNVGGRKITLGQAISYPSTHPLQNKSQKELDHLVNKLIRQRRKGVTGSQIAKGLGLTESTLENWIRTMGIEERCKDAYREFRENKKAGPRKP